MERTKPAGGSRSSSFAACFGIDERAPEAFRRRDLVAYDCLAEIHAPRAGAHFPLKIDRVFSCVAHRASLSYGVFDHPQASKV
jgi:hypothetical protein